MKKLIIISIVSLLVVLSAVLAYSQFVVYKNMPLADIEKSPQSYDQTRVKLEGVIIENIGAFLGPKYVLAELVSSEAFKIESAKKIALEIKEGSTVDLTTDYVSYEFNGTAYTQRTEEYVVVEGTIVYHGEAIDAPLYYLLLENIQ